jgi:hypothetical protein
MNTGVVEPRNTSSGEFTAGQWVGSGAEGGSSEETVGQPVSGGVTHEDARAGSACR